MDLETHIQDVVNVILFEDLHNVVLTGHSYGGMVVTGVLDRIPERLSHVMYFDAFVPEDQSVEKRKSEDKSWKVAASRGWTTRTFPGHHVAQLENPRGIASLIEEAVLDQNQ